MLQFTDPQPHITSISWDRSKECRESGCAAKRYEHGDPVYPNGNRTTPKQLCISINWYQLQ